jgi:hypothetical protein
MVPSAFPVAAGALPAPGAAAGLAAARQLYGAGPDGEASVAGGPTGSGRAPVVPGVWPRMTGSGSGMVKAVGRSWLSTCEGSEAPDGRPSSAASGVVPPLPTAMGRPAAGSSPRSPGTPGRAVQPTRSPNDRATVTLDCLAIVLSSMNLAARHPAAEGSRAAARGNFPCSRARPGVPRPSPLSHSAYHWGWKHGIYQSLSLPSAGVLSSLCTTRGAFEDRAILPRFWPNSQRDIA